VIYNLAQIQFKQVYPSYYQ